MLIFLEEPARLALEKSFSSFYFPFFLENVHPPMHFHSRNGAILLLQVCSRRARYTCKTKFWRFLLVCFSLFLFLRRPRRQRRRSSVPQTIFFLLRPSGPNSGVWKIFSPFLPVSSGFPPVSHHVSHSRLRKLSSDRGMLQHTNTQTVTHTHSPTLTVILVRELPLVGGE